MNALAHHFLMIFALVVLNNHAKFVSIHHDATYLPLIAELAKLNRLSQLFHKVAHLKIFQIKLITCTQEFKLFILLTCLKQQVELISRIFP